MRGLRQSLTLQKCQRSLLVVMPGSSIQATIDALRETLADLEHQAASDDLARLKSILLLRIADLESHRDSTPVAPPVNET